MFKVVSYESEWIIVDCLQTNVFTLSTYLLEWLLSLLILAKYFSNLKKQSDLGWEEINSQEVMVCDIESN